MTKCSPRQTPGLLERLASGPIICAEGYLFELERRGYLQAGAFVPEVVLEHPEEVKQLHREFVHAGSDVVEAFTYYAHREKLRIIGKEELLEPFDSLDVEMIRRLVENCKIRCRNQQTRESDAARFTATQCIDHAIRIRNPEMTDGGLGLVLPFPATLALERLPDPGLLHGQPSLLVRKRCFAERFGQLIEAPPGRGPIRESLEDHTPDRSAGREARFLLQKIDRRVASSGDLSAIERFESQDFSLGALQASAARFGSQRFKREMRGQVHEVLRQGPE